MTAVRDRVVLRCDDLDAALDLLTGAGLRLDVIWPADDPAVALLSGTAGAVRLERGEGSTVDPMVAAEPPAGSGAYELTRPEATSAGVGRAGMHYRDLLPTRQGGRFIASHIVIPAGGPVPDYVHHHRVRFQLIYCAAGWVEVVYEGQGEPFRLESGDCVLQPPGIRHRVLHASPGLEVVEISCPAEHPTFVEHDLELPSVLSGSERRWEGQLFVRHLAASAAWAPWRADGFTARDTGIGAATSELVGVRVVRPASGTAAGSLPAHGGEFLFWYVLAGTTTLAVGPRDSETLERGAAVAVPADDPAVLTDCSPDLELLEVSVPA